MSINASNFLSIQRVTKGTWYLIMMSMCLTVSAVEAGSIHSSSPSNKKSPASNAVDGNWQTEWISQAGKEAWFIVDLKKSQQLHGFVHIPRASSVDGRVVDYELYVSESADQWSKPVQKGKFKKQPKAFWWPNKKEVFETIFFKSTVKGRYVKFKALSEVNGKSFMSVGELQMITDKENPPYKNLTMAHLKGYRYAPSVHMKYKSKEATGFYNEVTVEKSSTGSYFMVCGWQGGYFGIQELNNSKKTILFSVWDSSSTNDKNEVLEDKRVKLLHKDEGTRVKRFGGEGTGGQSFYELDWKIGETYRFYMTAQIQGERSIFTGYFYHPDKKKWIKMVSFSTLLKKILIRNPHSFLEDFRRDYKSFKINRLVRFSNTFTKVDGQWAAVSKGSFTRDSNPHINIDGGLDKENHSFFLSTGGDVKNKSCPLWNTSTKTNLPDVSILKDLPE